MNIKHTQGISEISISRNVSCFCPMGNDNYTNFFDITFVPNEHLPDYCDIDKFIDGLKGSELIIEDAVDAVFKYIVESIAPIELEVVSSVYDAVHSPVTVIKKM